MGREFSRIRLLPSLTEGSLSAPGSMPHPNIPCERLPESFCLSRAKFEPLLHKPVVEHPKNIRIVHGAVTGRVAEGYTKKLTNVTDKARSDATEQEDFLVVDFSGLARVRLKLLKRLVKSEAFETKTYNSNIRYATVTFKVKEDMKGQLPIPGGYSAVGWFHTHTILGAFDRSIIFGARTQDDQSKLILRGMPEY